MQRQDLMSALEVLSSHPDDLMANRVVWGFYTERGEYDSVIMFAGKMFSEKSGQAGYERLWLYSGAFASQACVLGDSFDSAAYYLDRIIPFAGSGDSDDFLDAMIHNTAALYSLKTEMDYSAALEHYKAACASLEHSGNMVGLSTMLCNIASIYYVMRDSSGFEYAEQAYRISHDSQYGTRAYMVALSSLALAQMYSLKGDYGQAMSFVDKASVEIHEFPQFVPSLYLLYAEIYAAQGSDTQAEHYYEEAVAHEDDAEPSDRVLISLRYAEFLSVRGRNAEARGCLLHGLEISRSVSSMEYRSDLLTALADVSVKLGDDASAVKYYSEYRRDVDSMRYAQKERAFRQNQLLTKDLQIKEHELSLVKAHRRTILIVAVTVLISFILIVLIIANRRQNRMYRRLVALHQRTLAEKYREEKEVAAAVAGTPEPAGSASGDDRDRQLWQRLEEMMRVGKIYRNSDISLDRLAEMLGTNRTYVSRVINRYAGTTFYNYIHSARIDDASRILSDASSEIQLQDLAMEMGYNSQSSFYRAFVKETGVPPSKYREESLRIKAAC